MNKSSRIHQPVIKQANKLQDMTFASKQTILLNDIIYTEPLSSRCLVTYHIMYFHFRRIKCSQVSFVMIGFYIKKTNADYISLSIWLARFIIIFVSYKDGVI